jgi:hypothetical protein
MTLVLRMVKELSEHLGMASPTARELDSLLKDTDVAALSRKVDAVLNDD